MFRNPVLSRPTKTYRPRVEQLEERWCPSGGQLTLNAVVSASHQVTYSGALSGGDQTSGVQVWINNGNYATEVSTDSSGNYSVTTSQAVLGQVYASGMNSMLESTNTAYATVAVNQALTVAIAYGSGSTVTLSGHLTDIDASGQTVTFSGAASGTATTDSNGNYSLTTTVAATGAVQAAETDLWGQVANAVAAVYGNPPIIQNFTAIASVGTVWTFEGKVIDTAAAGMTVTFGGLPVLAGQTTIVNADGTFSITVTLPEGTNYGTATAITTDTWGQNSNLAMVSIC